MAELLIGMTIIGILAAIILPSLNANLNERLWSTQRKALYTRLSQAFTQMPAISGYGDYNATNGVDNVAEAFITKGLATNLKMNHICAVQYGASDEEVKAALKQCGISDRYQKQSGGNANFPLKYGTAIRRSIWINPINTNVAAFTTVNGESVAVYYNPSCPNKDIYIAPNSQGTISKDFICAAFVYDLNGLTGPNRMGKDMGVIGAIGPTDPELIYIDPVERATATETFDKVGALCRNIDKSAHVPTVTEAYAMLRLGQLYGYPIDRCCGWTRTLQEEDKQYAYYVSQGFGQEVDQSNVWGTTTRSSKMYTLCNRSLFRQK